MLCIVCRKKKHETNFLFAAVFRSPEKEWNYHLLESSINKITPVDIQTTETLAIFFILPELLKDVEMTLMGPFGQSIIKRLLQMKKNQNTPLLHNIVYSC